MKFVNNFLFLLIFLTSFQSCGKAYFPIELKLGTRAERLKGQEPVDIDLVPLTVKTASNANKTPYKRRIIEAGDLNKPAKIIQSEGFIRELYPIEQDPGPYKIGKGDVLSYSEIINSKDGSEARYITRSITVSDEGFISIAQLGKLKADGLNQSELEDILYSKLVASGLNENFELNLQSFRSKRIFIKGDNVIPRSIQYTNVPIFVEDVVGQLGIRSNNVEDIIITIYREEKTYVIPLKKLFKESKSNLRLFPGDNIYISRLNYRQESVLIVGESGAQRAVPINFYQRPTLAETIFAGNVLNNVTSDFSQIYVLRKFAKHTKAYHLDITDPSRINIAGKLEMRPDDIIFIATQPLSLYSRALSQILGSTGLTIQARDQVRSEVGSR